MLELRNVSRVYRSKHHAVHALDGINLIFPSHGLICVLGKSGCGKSTLLHILGGLDRPDGGELLVNGCSIRDFSRAELDAYRNSCVGFVFQEAHMLSGFSVRENLSLVPELQGRDVTEQQIEAALRAVGLEGLADRYPDELSGGQRQRLAMARALIKDPEIILADEPTGALDTKTGEQILALLGELAKSKTVIVITHNEELAKRYGDRIIRMRDGRVVSDSAGTEASRLNESIQERAFVKSHLSTKSAIRIGLSALFHKKLQLLATVLLCVVAFSFFGVVATMSSYDRERVVLRTLRDASISYVMMTPHIFVTQYSGTEVIHTRERAWEADDKTVAALSRETGMTLYPVFSGGLHTASVGGGKSDYVFSIENMKKSKEETEAFDGLVYGFSVLDEKAISAMGFELVGRMPMQGGEIVITEFLYRQFKTYGFCNTHFEESVDATLLSCALDDPNSILGKHFTVYTGKNKAYNFSGHEKNLPSYNFTIVGVLDTGFDYERYAAFLPGGDGQDGLMDEFLLQELTEALCCSPHALCYLSKQDILTMARDVSIGKQAWGATEADLNLDEVLFYASPGEAQGGIYVSSFHTESRMREMEIVWLDGRERTALAENELVVSSANLSYKMEIDYAPLTDAIIVLVGKSAWEATKATDSYYLRVREAAVAGFVRTELENYRAALLQRYGTLPDAELCSRWQRDLQAASSAAPFAGSPCAEEIIALTFDALAPAIGEFLRLPTDVPFVDTERDSLLYALTAMYDVEVNNKKQGGVPTVAADAEQGSKHLHTTSWLQDIYLRFFAAREAAQLRLWEDAAFLRYFHTVSGYTAEKWQNLEQKERRELVTEHYLEYVKKQAPHGNAYGTLSTFEMQSRAFDHLCLMAGCEGDNPYLGDLTLRALSLGESAPGAELTAMLQTYQPHIVGVFDVEKYRGDVINDTLFEECRAEMVRSAHTVQEYSARTGGYWSYVLGAMPQDKNAIRQLFCLDLTGEGVRFRMSNEILSAVDTFGNELEDITLYLGLVSLGLLVFAGLLMATLIGSSVSFRKREIGLLRSLGARSVDIHRIFAAKALVISLSCAIPAVLVSALSAVWINRAAHEAGVRLSVLYFSPPALLALVVAAVLSALVSSFLPILLMNKRPPAALLTGA